MRSNGGFSGAKKTIVNGVASGIWNIRDAQREQGAGNWKALLLDYLVVGGGGSGSWGGSSGSGGGGGGGGTSFVSSFAATYGVSYTVTVGGGGTSVGNGVGSNGVNSSFNSTIGGAGFFGNGGTGGTGTLGNGGNGAAGVNTGTPSAAQNGQQSNISGANTYYGGGGGGGTKSGQLGVAGLGGGGSGGPTGNNATANTGGGGGGSGTDNIGGGQGASGLVIIRYSNTFGAATTTTGSPTFVTTGGYRIYTFNASGSITF